MEANDMKAVETPECAIKPLSLDEAIAHADEVAGDCCTACRREHKQLADWLRELKSRRSAECGSVVKLREALESIASNLERRLFARYPSSASDEWMYQKANTALAEPVRNCDVGTSEEQAKRMDAFCASHGERIDNGWRCDNCPLCSINRCELAWAQMPYVEKEGGAK